MQKTQNHLWPFRQYIRIIYNNMHKITLLAELILVVVIIFIFVIISLYERSGIMILFVSYQG